MSEAEFWSRLRSTVINTPGLGLGWCDWIEPKSYRLADSESEVKGKIGFVDGCNTSVLPFVLHLGSQPTDREQVDWEQLLPTTDDAGNCWIENETMHFQLRRSESQ